MTAAVSQVGRGGTGLLDRLRGFGDFQLDGGASRRAYLELALGKGITRTGTYLGSIHYTDIPASTLTWAGCIRPVVGLECQVEPRVLTRVERLADVVAGTWYTDDSTVETGGTVTVYYQLPDSSNPGTAELLVHLLFTFAGAGEVHPVLGRDLLVDGSFAYWTNSTTPTYWSKVNEAATGVAITQQSDPAPASYDPYCCQVAPGASGLAAASSGGVAVFGPKAGVGRHYWLPFAYKTDEVMPAGLQAALRVRGATGVYMLVDGELTQAGSNELALRPTNGEWRRGLFVWRQPEDSSTVQVYLLLHNTSGAAATSGWVRFDAARVLPAYRYAYWMPALELGSIPEVEVRAASAFFDRKSMAIGDVALLEDRHLNLLKCFGELYSMRKPVAVYVGGAFANEEELRRDDWRTAFVGLTQTPRAKTGQVVRVELEIEDARTITKARALEDVHRPAPGVDLARPDEGVAKGLLFGQTLEPIIRAQRVAADANGYGAYEHSDSRVPVATGVPMIIPAGWAPTIYPNEELADKGQLGLELSNAITGNTVANPTVVTCLKRHGLATNDQATISGSNSTPNIDGRRTVTVVSEFAFSVAVNVTVAGTAGKVVSHADLDFQNQNTRVVVKRDQQNLRYNRAGEDLGTDCVFVFDTEMSGGVGDKVVSLPVEGPPWRVAQDLQAAMRTAVGGGDTATNVTHSESTHKFTVTRSGAKGVFINLYTAAASALAAHAIQDGWRRLGYNGKDHGGSGTFQWVAENPVFKDADSDHVLRWPGGGYKDDATGSVAGVADAAIDSPAAVAAWLWKKVVRLPDSRLDLLSFAAARSAQLSGDFSQLFMYVDDGEKEVFKLLGIADQVGLMDTVIDGDGVLRAIKHSDGAQVMREFYDRDYTSFESWNEPAMLYTAVRVWGSYYPALKKFDTYGDAPAVLSAPLMRMRHGATAPWELEGFLDRAMITSGLQKVSTYYARLIGKVPRWVEFSCVGKLVDLLVGHRIKVTASRALGAGGQMAAVNFRVVGLRHNYLAASSTCLAVEDVQILT